MPIVVKCGRCGKAYCVSDGAVGKKLRCRKCGKIIPLDPNDHDESEDSIIEDFSQIEVEDDTIDRRIDRRSDDSGDSEETSAIPSLKRPAANLDQRLVAIVVGIVAGLLATGIIVGFVVFFASGSSETPAKPKTEAPKPASSSKIDHHPNHVPETELLISKWQAFGQQFKLNGDLAASTMVSTSDQKTSLTERSRPICGRGAAAMRNHKK